MVGVIDENHPILSLDIMLLDRLLDAENAPNGPHKKLQTMLTAALGAETGWRSAPFDPCAEWQERHLQEHA